MFLVVACYCLFVLVLACPCLWFAYSCLLWLVLARLSWPALALLGCVWGRRGIAQGLAPRIPSRCCCCCHCGGCNRFAVWPPAHTPAVWQFGHAPPFHPSRLATGQ
eukprot:14046430-Alexandrium_andersonii.AAC.1